MENNQNGSAYDSGKVDVSICPTGEDLYITEDLLAREEELEYFVINI